MVLSELGPCNSGLCLACFAKVGMYGVRAGNHPTLTWSGPACQSLPSTEVTMRQNMSLGLQNAALIWMCRAAACFLTKKITLLILIYVDFGDYVNHIIWIQEITVNLIILAYNIVEG